MLKLIMITLTDLIILSSICFAQHEIPSFPIPPTFDTEQDRIDYDSYVKRNRIPGDFNFRISGEANLLADQKARKVCQERLKLIQDITLLIIRKNGLENMLKEHWKGFNMNFHCFIDEPSAQASMDTIDLQNGFFSKVYDSSGLAFVISHELAHVLLSHGIRSPDQLKDYLEKSAIKNELAAQRLATFFMIKAELPLWGHLNALVYGSIINFGVSCNKIDRCVSNESVGGDYYPSVRQFYDEVYTALRTLRYSSLKSTPVSNSYRNFESRFRSVAY